MNAKTSLSMLFGLIGIALTANALGAACNSSSSYTVTDPDGGTLTCFKGSENNDTTSAIQKDDPFGVTDWIFIDKHEEDHNGTYISASIDQDSGSWSISSSIWSDYDQVMVTFKSGNGNGNNSNGFGDYEAILLSAEAVAGTFSISQDLSHASVWGSKTAVPLPAAAYLFGSALLGMAGIGYRRNKKQA